jgi:hypothetical protein
MIDTTSAKVKKPYKGHVWPFQGNLWVYSARVGFARGLQGLPALPTFETFADVLLSAQQLSSRSNRLESSIYHTNTILSTIDIIYRKGHNLKWREHPYPYCSRGSGRRLEKCL